VSDPLDFGNLFGDFFGRGAVPPESVARKILGIGSTLPLNREGVLAAFRWRIKLLRPDLSDDAADRLRLNDITDEELPEFDAGSAVRFDAGSKQEQLAELLWAREDLLGRIPKPVTDASGTSHAATTPSVPVTQWGKRAKERLDESMRRAAERGDEERRDEHEAEWERQRRREVRREAKHRRARRKPRDLRCRDCGKPIDREEVAVAGEPWREEFLLNPYAVRRAWWSEGGYYHPGCLLDLPLRPVGWLKAYLADGVPLEINCEVCGRRVKPPRWVKRRGGGRVFYCSEGCAGGADAIARRVEQDERECAVCGEAFTPTRSDARFCSNACRQDAYRKRKLGGSA
jgi:hypothetical protein